MSFSFVVPTHREDRPLARCLNSIQHQMQPGDEVLVIGDTYDGPLPMVEMLVSCYGKTFYYVPFDAGHHCYGHCQINHALEFAQADYLHVNDDDDVWAPDARALMQQAVDEDPERPHLFRFRSQFGTIFWDQRGVVARNHIGGHCLVAPNIPGKVGKWECIYQGDFDYIRTTLDLHGGDESAVWHDELIAIARPG